MSKVGGFLFVLVNLLQGASSYYPFKLNDARAVYLVKERFAVHADGIGDDAPALQQAIDRVQESTDAGVVFVPEGKYRIGKTVNIWRGIRLIGYGKQRPVFILGENTPGYQSGAEKYMIHFRDARPKPGEPLRDARSTTFFSGVSNVDIELKDGNPAAIAIRFHVAQLSSLEHMDFRIGSALGAVEAIGNEIEDCRFYGGEFAIRTGATSPGWQALVLDSVFEGQRWSAIETSEAGLTMIRDVFRHVPRGIVIAEGKDEKLYVKDSLFEDVASTGIAVDRYWDPRTQVNIVNVQCARVPVFLAFREIGWPPYRVPEDAQSIPGAGPAYLIRRLAHGLHHENAGSKAAVRKLKTVVDLTPLSRLSAVPPKDFPDLPAGDTWVNVAELGAKGDGTHDDTAIFQQAIAKHRAVYVPIGCYRLSDTLRLRPDTALIGLNPMATQLILASSTRGFTSPSAPKAVVETPKGGASIFTGIGIDAKRNKGAVLVKWMAGDKSYLDDVLFSWGEDRDGKKGEDQYYGLWITDGGGGTFKNIWAPNSLARDGFHVSDTSTEGRVYEISVEHHLDVEVELENVRNWTFYALQTEENLGSEKAMALDIERSKNIVFANLFMYRIRASAAPYSYAVRVRDSGPIRFLGVHNFSHGPFPFDYTLFHRNSGNLVLERELTYLTVE